MKNIFLFLQIVNLFAARLKYGGEEVKKEEEEEEMFLYFNFSRPIYSFIFNLSYRVPILYHFSLPFLLHERRRKKRRVKKKARDIYIFSEIFE